MSHVHWPRNVIAGTGKLQVNRMRSHTVQYSDSDDVVNAAQLKQALQEDGYLYLKGVIPTHHVQESRNVILSHLNHLDFIELHPSGIPSSFQQTNPENPHVPLITNPSPNLMKDQEWISQTHAVQQVLEYPDLARIIQAVSEKPCEHAGCLPFKWLRAVGTGLYTGLHADRKYIHHIHPDLLTFWIPLDHIPSEKGGLIVCPKSHTDPTWSSIRLDYLNASSLGKDGTESGWIARDPRQFVEQNGIPEESAQWVSADFEPGDVVLFGQDIFHISGTNTTDTWRLSCDTRWLPFTNE